ncbi:MAG: D-alanyl-D-alanine carboxypeptidase/D-alanyl-D-alanine-endopeptidase [Chromatiales bacterium]|jgi:D-alanyl-D-alanine carboxypeptidase/D-alanyl-D-alanine-endopeptidase (penicillin-binding protein 4)
MSPLPDEVDKVLHKHKIPAADLSLYVSEVSADTPTLTLNAATPRNPASVMKLLTSLMALDTLGPNYRWRTEAYIRGTLKQGTLDGDLILKGYGDPVLTPERFWQFLYGLQQRGLNVIQGDLILDGSYFAPPRDQRGDFDGRPRRAYNALPHPLSLNFQATQVHLLPDKANESVRAFTYPPLANLEIHNQMKLVDGTCRGKRASPVLHLAEQHNGATLELQGEYAASCPEWNSTYLVMEPSEHIGGAFRALWKELGGELKGSVKTGRLPQGSQRFHSNESPTLTEVIRDMNKYSNNLMSRMLLLTVAAEQGALPASPEQGFKLIKDWLVKWQLPSGLVRVKNGSGLARDAQISSEIIGRMLQAAYTSPLMPEFISSLPLVGIDGTMRKRLRKTDLVGRAHIKTGSLNNVSAMAGYVQDRHDQRWVVALIINHKGLQSWRGKQVQDAVLRWVYEGPKPTPLTKGQITTAAVTKCEGGKKSASCKSLQ